MARDPDRQFLSPICAVLAAAFGVSAAVCTRLAKIGRWGKSLGNYWYHHVGHPFFVFHFRLAYQTRINGVLWTWGCIQNTGWGICLWFWNYDSRGRFLGADLYSCCMVGFSMKQRRTTKTTVRGSLGIQLGIGGTLVATPFLLKRKRSIFYSKLVCRLRLGILDLSVMRVMFAGKQVHTCTIAAVALAASRIVGSRHGFMLLSTRSTWLVVWNMFYFSIYWD